MDPFKLKVWNMTDMTEAEKQQLRLRRLLLALIAYSIPMAMMLVAWGLGLMRIEAIYVFLVIPIIANGIFYLLIKTGLNLRRKDTKNQDQRIPGRVCHPLRTRLSLLIRECQRGRIGHASRKKAANRQIVRLIDKVKPERRR